MSAPLVKTMIAGSALLAASAVLMVLGMFVTAFAAGRTIAGGERAVVAAGIFDLGVIILAIGVFFWTTRSLATLPRVLSLGALAILELVVLAVAMLLTLVLLNR